MNTYKNLKGIHRKYLEEQGLRPKNYLLKTHGADYFEFYNRKTGKIELFRR